MKLSFTDRPFPGENARPTPEVHVDPSVSSAIVAVPWGARESGRKVIDRMTEYLAFASQDHEATSPLPRMTCLSTAANNLRTAAMLANDMLYREDNRDEYRAGVELFAATLYQNELSIVQVGGPHVLLARGTQSLLPIGSSIDLALDLGIESKDRRRPLSALPAQLMGLESHVNLTINSFRARPGDKLVLLSHSRAPEAVFSWKSNDIDTDKMVRELARRDGRSAFWLGVLSIEGDSIKSAADLSSPNGDVA